MFFIFLLLSLECLIHSLVRFGLDECQDLFLSIGFWCILLLLIIFSAVFIIIIVI